MIAPNQWQQSNARQLAAALADLRDRLERFISAQTSTASPAPKPTDAASVPPVVKAAPSLPAARAFTRSSILRLLTGSGEPPNPTPEPAAVSATATLASEPIPEGAATGSAPAAELPWALDELTERLNLSVFERNILLLCAAMELDTRIAGLCARAQDDPQRPYPTFALVLALFEDPSWDALSPAGPLRFWRLLEINQSAAQPLTGSALRADERIVNFLKGLNHLDDRLMSFLLPLDLEAGPAALAPSQDQVVELILRRWQLAAQTGPLPAVQLVGPDPLAKQLVACYAAAKLNRGLYRLPTELLPSTPADLEMLARLWQREGRLLPLALYLEAEDLDAHTAESGGALSRFLARSDGVFFVGVRQAMVRPGRAFFTVDVAKPSAAEQRSAWAQVLGSSAPASPAALADQFSFNLPNIEKLAAQAQAEAQDTHEPLADKVWEVCCASERPRLDALAQCLQPRRGWEDLVLPAPQIAQLRQIAAQVRQRNKVYHEWGFASKLTQGLSISALFSGDSGTGKTMAAEVIAQDLRLNLYRIDLSAVVNKYIGETEKNLRRLFDAAEDVGAILFFDEADALFGKRSEVKDSHDRYANIEVNYLLQRIEAYRGLAILATNMKSALDTAFLRRIRFCVPFYCPGPADRRRLWEKAFRQSEAAKNLPAPPLDQLDFDRLAKLNLTGADIQTVALNAAFMAAHAGTNVTMPLILQATRAEVMKKGSPVNEADFRWTEPAAPKAVVSNGQPVPA